MAYIGNQPISAAFLTDTFSGTGSQTAFTMSIAPANTSSCLVVVSGVTQDPSTYSVSGTTLTFSAAPPSGTSNISVRYLGIPASGVTTTAYRTVTEFTATSGQTSFSVPSYTVGYIDVYRNGVMLGTADFTATTGTTVVLATGATTGDLIRTESFYVSSVLNAIPNSPASVGSSNIVSGVSLTSPTLITPALGTPASGVMTNVTSVPAAQLTGAQAIPKATLPTGCVLQVVQGLLTTPVSTGTNNTWVTTGLTASITPTSSTSKILATVSGFGYTNGSAVQMVVTLYRNSTNLSAYGFSQTYAGSSATQGGVSFMYLDSPATTSSTTYTVYFTLSNSAGTVTFNSANAYGQPIATIVLQEIAA